MSIFLEHRFKRHLLAIEKPVFRDKFLDEFGANTRRCKRFLSQYALELGIFSIVLCFGARDKRTRDNHAGPLRTY